MYDKKTAVKIHVSKTAVKIHVPKTAVKIHVGHKLAQSFMRTWKFAASKSILF